MAGQITGLTTPGPLSRIADGIRARLLEVFPDNQFAHVWVPPRLTRDGWKTLTRRTPLIGIGWSDVPPNEGNTALLGMSRWTVLVGTKNQSGPKQRLFGDNLAPGLFDIATVAAAVLHGHAIAGDGSIKVTEVAHAAPEDFDDEDLAVAQISLTIATDLSLANVLADLSADLTTQSITWTFGDATLADQGSAS